MIGSAVTDITFDTDDLPATRIISRTGGNFIILSGGYRLYTFALQSRITTLTPSGHITILGCKNDVTIPNTGVRNSSTGDNDTGCSFDNYVVPSGGLCYQF